MNDEDIRPGFFKDKYGRWHKDRRKGGDRRGMAKAFDGHNQRRMYRRKADRVSEVLAEQAIEDALEDFAAEHDGHL